MTTTVLTPEVLAAQETEKNDILAYAAEYIKKHPDDLLEETRLPNSAETFKYHIYNESINVLAEPYVKAIGG
jgi:hypothetical protein